jgi:hypothetical protein
MRFLVSQIKKARLNLQYHLIMFQFKLFQIDI